MQYMLMIYSNEAGWTELSEEEQNNWLAAYGAYTEALTKAGAIVSGSRLQPSAAATTVRSRDGKSQVLDGPFIDTKEQLGGYYMIDVPDLDAAISWAVRCPAASYGTVEVRPLWTEDG